MEGPAGTKLPEKIIEYNHCGSDHPGWLNGSHPTTLNAIVDREVCFRFGSGPSNSCHNQNQIQIRNCGDFYLYYLGNAPGCLFRYCSE